jgi:SAM-dependent methyltransferase
MTKKRLIILNLCLFIVSIVLTVYSIGFYHISTRDLFSLGYGQSEIQQAERRNEIIRSYLQDPKKLSLEIGPYFCPVLKGNNVKYFDIFNQRDLIELAKIDPIPGVHNNIDKIPYIHYVEPSGDMRLINEKFDIIFSSHNIEHQVSLIRHLQQVDRLLNAGGIFVILIPDCRYCFDHFIPATPLSEILENFHENPKNYPLRTILAQECEVAHNFPPRHWNSDHGFIKAREIDNCYQQALLKFKNANGKHIEAHRWRFTPESFKVIIDNLYQMNYINLSINKIYQTVKGDNEFAVVLTKMVKEK